MATTAVDRRADFASVLAHPVRRKIRDVLRNNDALTLTEIARSIGHSEQNTHHHLTKMLEVGIVSKHTTKLNGKLLTLYTLSEQYEELFGNQKPDILPLYILSFIYGIMTIMSIVFPYIPQRLYGGFGITDKGAILAINLMSFLTTFSILAYYKYYEKFVLGDLYD